MRIPGKRSPAWSRGFAWLLALGPLFFASYGLSNWLTARRANVPSFAFGWEHEIPFMPWTIVPYWSVDFLYAASLLIRRTKDDLDAHAQRLMAAQVMCVTGFLLFPLRFSSAKPPVNGVFAPLFASLAAFDQPYNQAPSLHLAIGAILWAFYSAHLSGISRLLMQCWLVLTGISTLTTFQHHFIDVPCGIAVGLLAILLFPARPDLSRTLCAAYLGGSFLLGAVAVRFGGAAWLLIWPACALLIPAAAYATRQPAVFGKRYSAMAVLLAPWLAAVWLNSRCRRAPAVQHVADGVWIGRAAGRSRYQRGRFDSVVDVTAEFPPRHYGIEYRSIPMLDLVPPAPVELSRAAEAIEDFADRRPTLVFCALGYSRSVAAIATWLGASGRAASASSAIEMIRRVRPQIVLDEAHAQAIQEALSATPARHLSCVIR